MNKTNTKKTIKKQVKKKDKNAKFDSWLGRSTEMLLDLYGIGEMTIVFHEKTMPDHNSVKGSMTMFRINCSTAYKTANIWYYPGTVDMFNRKKMIILEQALTHEISHIITDPLATLANERYVSKREMDDAVENLTETFGQIGRKLLKAEKIKMV